jgi:hypothetical protein
MSERPEPDLDRVREALRDHDEREEQDERDEAERDQEQEAGEQDGE